LPYLWELLRLYTALLSLAAALATMGEPSSIPAETSDDLPLRLSWKAPAACPDASSERAKIRQRVGSIDKAQAAVPIVAEAEIRTTATGSFQLSLHTIVGQTVGERELSGQDCQQLADAAALVLALLINPKALPKALPQAALVPDLPAPAEPQSPKQPVRHDETGGQIDKGHGLGLAGVLGRGLLPGLAEGFDVRLILYSGRWAVMVRAGGFLAKETGAPILPGTRATFYRLEGALAACGQTQPRRRVGATACLGGALVRLHGESSGVSDAGAASAYWPEALAEISGHIRLTSWARLRLSLEGRLGHSPEFAILGLGSVYRPATASLRGALGFDMLF